MDAIISTKCKLRLSYHAREHLGILPLEIAQLGGGSPTECVVGNFPTVMFVSPQRRRTKPVVSGNIFSIGKTRLPASIEAEKPEGSFAQNFVWP